MSVLSLKCSYTQIKCPSLKSHVTLKAAGQMSFRSNVVLKCPLLKSQLLKCLQIKNPCLKVRNKNFYQNVHCSNVLLLKCLFCCSIVRCSNVQLSDVLLLKYPFVKCPVAQTFCCTNVCTFAQMLVVDMSVLMLKWLKLQCPVAQMSITQMFIANVRSLYFHCSNFLSFKCPVIWWYLFLLHLQFLHNE